MNSTGRPHRSQPDSNSTTLWDTTKVAEALANERFGNEALIDRVEVKPDDDPDYPEMWIRIVVDTPGEAPLDINCVSGFHRDLGPAHEEKGIHAFPIPGFVSYTEIGEAA